jgi:hypothetical protein
MSVCVWCRRLKTIMILSFAQEIRRGGPDGYLSFIIHTPLSGLPDSFLEE